MKIVHFVSTKPQMTGKPERTPEVQGEAQDDGRREEVQTAKNGAEHSGMSCLMERVVERPNLQAALKRVKQNKGSAGVDGMTTGELPDYLREHWLTLREQLLNGLYQPAPVKRHEIPKSSGGMRELGIPTVLDRFIQQALLQVLQPLFDPGFSTHSYGFRPGRNAHGAIREARRYLEEGRHTVVDVDLEKFFDRVNHDVLMGRLAKRIVDRRVLGLIRRYLNAGALANGIVMERQEGTPQGGPLSPLLANVLLDEVDKELERRGHAFVRYADDCNVYVRSQRAGERVMELLRRLYAKLRLRINETKSAVGPAWKRKFLGYSFYRRRRSGAICCCVADKAVRAMKDRVREITSRNCGRSIAQVSQELRSYLLGWREYYRLAETPGVFGALDEWIRRRLRCLHLKQWKQGSTIFRRVRARGLPVWLATIVAAHSHRLWHNAKRKLNLALPIRYFDELGIPRLRR